ncbi:MAG: HlyD family type I secretion periplasmic adaptor subunit [Pseudomonadota bacterium]
MSSPKIESKQPPAGFVVDTSDALPRRIGLLIILVVFGGFGLFAMFAPMDSAALAQGEIEVQGNRKTVQHLEGGIVNEILVTDGQEVALGQPLLTLDATQEEAELAILMGNFYSALAKENRMAAERDGLVEILFSSELNVDDARAFESKKNEQQIFIARRTDRLGEVEVLEQNIEQLESKIEGLQALVDSKSLIVDSYTEEVTDLSELLTDGFVDKQRLRELERSRSRVIGEVADHEAEIAQAQTEIGEAKLGIIQLNNRFTTAVVDELAQVQAAIFDLRERILAIDYRLDRTEITAPAAGIVLGMNTHTVGGVIQPGQPLLDIVPEEATLVIDARVSPKDIDSVSIGSEATIRFSAFNAATTPIMKGILTKVSADILVDQVSGRSYYLARIELSEESEAMLGSLILVPGMPVEVLLKTGERTLFQYLAKPATNAFARSLIED